MRLALFTECYRKPGVAFRLLASKIVGQGQPGVDRLIPMSHQSVQERLNQNFTLHESRDRIDGQAKTIEGRSHTERGWFSRRHGNSVKQNLNTVFTHDVGYQIKIAHGHAAGKQHYVVRRHGALHRAVKGSLAIGGNSVISGCRAGLLDLRANLITVAVAYSRRPGNYCRLDQLISCCDDADTRTTGNPRRGTAACGQHGNMRRPQPDALTQHNIPHARIFALTADIRVRIRTCELDCPVRHGFRMFHHNYTVGAKRNSRPCHDLCAFTGPDRFFRRHACRYGLNDNKRPRQLVSPTGIAVHGGFVKRRRIPIATYILRENSAGSGV